MPEDTPTSASALPQTPEEEHTRQNERIALLEVLLVDAQQQAVVQVRQPERSETRPSPCARHTRKSTTPEVRLPPLDPQIQGMAQALLAAASARTSAPPSQEAPMAESTARLEVSELRKAHQSLHEQRPPMQGPVRSGRGKLLLAVPLLIGIAAAGAFVSIRARIADEERSRLSARVAAPSALRTPITMAQPSPEDTLSEETPTIAPVQEARHPLLGESPRIEILPDKAASRPVQTEPRPVAVRRFRPRGDSSAGHTNARQTFATARPSLFPRAASSMRRAPYPPHYFQSATSLSPPRYSGYSMRLHPFSHKSGAFSAPKLRKPPHHRREAPVITPPHAHPKYEAQKDAWMDRLP